MAFILVQHLAPDHKSILAELVQRFTRMPVFEVTDGMAVEPNCIYINPPNRDMALTNGSLQLLEPTIPRGLRLPIDYFFCSMAEDQKERAIGVILSGTGSDGTRGARAIKSHGGMVMAQDPESTEFNGMPRSAIATGLVDFELKPQEMAGKLISYVAQAFSPPPRAKGPLAPAGANALRQILSQLRSRIGHDFSHYKMNTVNRRIERRMAVHQFSSIDGYLKYLKEKPTEVDALFRDLLIGVTRFFRDSEAFLALEEQVIPQLMSSAGAGGTVRVWVPGCSTGEEAYSLAILLAERQETQTGNIKLQIFATDIDPQAIAIARAGQYPASIAAEVSPTRLERFFRLSPNGTHYRIKKSIRDTVIFSEQDMIQDPPFSRLDLLSCRNLLIYLDGDLQKKLIPLFHYSIRPGGFLFLGSAETTGEFNDLFTPVDRKAKLYQRRVESLTTRRISSDRLLTWPPGTEVTKEASSTRVEGKRTSDMKRPFREIAERTLLQRFAPAAVLVNALGDILYVNGRTGQYLEPAPGEVSVPNILKMAREGLRPELTMSLHAAAQTKAVVERRGIRVKTNGHYTAVQLMVWPVPAGTGDRVEDPLFLVAMQEEPEAAPIANLAVSDPEVATDERVAALQQELRAKEMYLQAANEQLETANEELQSSNEEMQSVNEELQSSNEELETSKEELQSVNEELATVNGELQSKVTELTRSNNDMNNLLAGTGIATVYVDHKLRILRFTPAATRIINLIASDVGRPVGHLSSNLPGYSSLAADVQVVLDTLIPKEGDVQARGGDWYTMRIQPYRTVENVIEGAVITFVDISVARRALEELGQTQAILQTAMDQGNAGVVIANVADGRMRYVNEAWLKLRGIEGATELTDPLAAVWHLRDCEGRELEPGEIPLTQAMATGKACTRELVTRRANGEERVVMANAAPVYDAAGRMTAGLMVLLDTTEERRAEAERMQADHLGKFEAVVRDWSDAIVAHDMEGRIIAWNPGAEAMFGWTAAEALEMNIRELIPEPDREEALGLVQRLSQSEILESYRALRVGKDGQRLEVVLTATALTNSRGGTYAIATLARQVNRRRDV